MNSSASPDLTTRPRNAATIAGALDILVGEDSRIGVAVSGGSDSLALLHHARLWAGSTGRTLHAATVDHGLRPEAAKEAAYVAEVCAAMNVPHQTLNWRASGKRISQAAARAARHELLSDWASANALSAIALGHTQDDRLETFLIRARAGSGWYGLAGPMPAAPTPSPAAAPVRLIRPLLAHTRADLRSDLSAIGLDWIDDPTNRALRHERVRMRHLLAATPASARACMLRTMNRLCELRAAVLAGAREVLKQHTSVEADGAELETAALARLSLQSRLRLLEALIQSYAPRSAPLRSDRLDRLATTLVGTDVPPKTTLGGCQFSRGAQLITISPAPPRRGDSPPRPPLRTPAQRARELLMDPLVSLLRITP